MFTSSGSFQASLDWKIHLTFLNCLLLVCCACKVTTFTSVLCFHSSLLLHISEATFKHAHNSVIGLTCLYNLKTGRSKVDKFSSFFILEVFVNYSCCVIIIIIIQLFSCCRGNSCHGTQCVSDASAPGAERAWTTGRVDELCLCGVTKSFFFFSVNWSTPTSMKDSRNLALGPFSTILVPPLWAVLTWGLGE